MRNEDLPRSLDELYNTPIKKRRHKRRINDDIDQSNAYYADDYDKYDTDEIAAKRKIKYTKSDDTKTNDTKYNDTDDNNEKDDPKPITCPICYDDVKIAYVTKCNHNFCYGCVDKLISRSTNNEWACPICRKICKT
jgi:hypothetical protein